MKRVVILGPGASGKSTFAVRLGQITGLPVVELDKLFWRQDLIATPPKEWIMTQQSIVQKSHWILDGDLGPYDAVEVRLKAADTIIFLDFSLLRCAWRALRRSRERLDFWLWLLRYRPQSRPCLMRAISEHAPAAELHLLRTPESIAHFLKEIASTSYPTQE
jgi:adenylate kinase family enzyme